MVGTRPECVKLAPLIHELARRGRPAVVINSGQHRDAVHRTLHEFGIRAAWTLEPHAAAPNLLRATRILQRRLASALHAVKTRRLIVQGDTLSAFAAARAGVQAGCHVAHVEAGLRTARAGDPFPEEWFRRRIAGCAHVHFAPTELARDNLLREGVPGRDVHVVGNTGIDALRTMLEQEGTRNAGRPSNRVIVTIHRRENWDANADTICAALLDIAARRPELELLVPVHPNPRLAPRLRRTLGGHARIALVAPLGYREFIAQCANAALLISDSGGVQEEAPHLGVPLLVPRSCTERPEALATGFVWIVPVDREAIVSRALRLLAARRRAPVPFDAAAPFGDGRAAARIADVIAPAERSRCAA